MKTLLGIQSNIKSGNFKHLTVIGSTVIVGGSSSKGLHYLN